MATKLKSFEEERQRADTLSRLPPHLAPIELRKVVGSVSQPKVAGLTKDFLPRGAGMESPRFRSVYNAMQGDVPLPPIEVYALRGRYYVVDGHNRVAAARALGYAYLDALVHEFLLPATSAENRLHNERLHFRRTSGLTEIELTEAGQYRKLLSQIREHQFFLGQNGRVASFKAAAQDWQEYVFQPIAERLASGSVPGHFPGRTSADLYIYLCDYKWVKSQNRGMDIGFPKALSDFEHLYPPQHGTALAAPFHALMALARPVLDVAAPGRRRDHGDDTDDADDAEAPSAPCPICGKPMREAGTAACDDCRVELATAAC